MLALCTVHVKLEQIFIRYKLYSEYNTNLFGLAPWSSRCTTTFKFPSIEATNNAVCPLVFWMSIS